MGATKDRLKTDLAAALRAKDEAAKSNIRMMLAAITTEEVAGVTARALSDAEELTVINQELRKRRDSAETYASAGRPELAAKEASEAEFIATYLPARLTDDELQVIVEEEVSAFAATGEQPEMRHMGRLVKAVKARADGRADGGVVAARVRAALTS